MTWRVRWIVVAAIACLCVAGWGPRSARAQDERQNEAGKFDFYVLALSWSPSYCEASQERRRGDQRRPDRDRPDPQCAERAYSFVVHGLWPQYDRGFPEYCQVPAPRLARPIVSSMLDLMPSPRLVFNQWDKHGVCSGLPARAYFDTIRKARAVVKIPPGYLAPQTHVMVTPDEIEEAFVAANPGLPRAGVSVQCSSTRLSEVRICLTKDLAFQDCPEVDRRACRRDQIAMPPTRGGG